MSDALLIKLLSEIQRWLISLYPFSEMEIRPLVYATGLLHSALFSASQMQHCFLASILYAVTSILSTVLLLDKSIYYMPKDPR